MEVTVAENRDVKNSIMKSTGQAKATHVTLKRGAIGTLECHLCGRIGQGRMKGWGEAVDIPPPFETGGWKAVRVQRAEFRWRGSGRFICPVCMERARRSALCAPCWTE
jgi:hypothetical protein